MNLGLRQLSVFYSGFCVSLRPHPQVTRCSKASLRSGSITGTQVLSQHRQHTHPGGQALLSGFSLSLWLLLLFLQENQGPRKTQQCSEARESTKLLGHIGQQSCSLSRGTKDQTSPGLELACHLDAGFF